MLALRAFAAISRDRLAVRIRVTWSPSPYGAGDRSHYEDRDGCWTGPLAGPFRRPRRLRARRHVRQTITDIHADRPGLLGSPAFTLRDVQVFYRGETTSGGGQQCAIYADQRGFGALVPRQRRDGSPIPGIELAERAAREIQQDSR